MSCGNPHETPCHEVLHAVSAYLDGERTDVDRAKIAQHVDECGPCFEEFGIYQEVKVLVHRCCGGEEMPAEVRAQVVSRIRAVTVSYRTEAPDQS